LPHFLVSSAISLPNVASDPDNGTLPRSARRALSKPGVDRFVQNLDDLGRGVAGRADPIERHGSVARRVSARVGRSGSASRKGEETPHPAWRLHPYRLRIIRAAASTAGLRY
jgi:hypothetical protein